MLFIEVALAALLLLVAGALVRRQAGKGEERLWKDLSAVSPSRQLKTLRHPDHLG